MRGSDQPSTSTGPVVDVRDDVFINVQNANYNQFISALSQKEKTELASAQSLKLHISIHSDDYPAHKNNIVAILRRYVANGDIKEFKFVDNDALKAKIAKFKEKNKGAENNPVYKDMLLTANRFMKGDQFTIYVRDDDNQAIENLLSEVNDYLILHQVQPGTRQSIASAVTPHINFRQEYFNNKRVDATINDRQQVKEMQKMQSTNPLYQHLLASNLWQKGLIGAALLGIEQYGKRDRSEELSLASRLFDAKRGIIRAANYKELLNNYYNNHSPMHGLVVLYALLKYSKSTHLVEDVNAQYRAADNSNFVEAVGNVLAQQLPQEQVEKIAAKIAETLDKKRMPSREVTDQLDKLIGVVESKKASKK